jgi:hypothetical protein
MSVHPNSRKQRPWNKGVLIGQKKPLEPKHVWSIRVRLEIGGSRRDLAIFNLAIDSKLNACDLVKLRLDDVCSRLQAANLGMATYQSLPEAVKLMEQGIFIFMKDVSSVTAATKSASLTADVMVKAMKISGMTSEDISQNYKFGAPGARILGMSEQTMLGFDGVLKKAGIGGDQAGTAFRALMATVHPGRRSLR